MHKTGQLQPTGSSAWNKEGPHWHRAQKTLNNERIVRHNSEVIDSSSDNTEGQAVEKNISSRQTEPCAR